MFSAYNGKINLRKCFICEKAFTVAAVIAGDYNHTQAELFLKYL